MRHPSRWLRRRNESRRRRSRLRLEPLEPRVLLSGHPLITEFLAINDSALVDVDGDRSDWIELHNPTAASIELAGWHLTDEAGCLDKWTFPAVSVEPGDYLLVFASEKDRRDPAGELHTNFALAGDGDYLALVEPGGTPVSEYPWPYPAQRSDVSYGLAPIEAETLIASFAPATALVPTDDSLGLTWTQQGLDDSSWEHGTTGAGYERRAGYEGLIGLDLESAMYGATATAYVRVPFAVDDPARFDVLTLRMKYDDGFVAYLNGTEVARRNAPETLGYDAAATVGHADSAAVVFESIDVSGHLGLLEPGDNVLAIHGLNSGTTSTDLLILPELVASDTDIDPSAHCFFTVPTPGSANAEGYAGLVAEPAFDHVRGLYDASFDLALTCDTDGATLRYTTDGSTPSATAGDVYSAPMPIATTAVVRAIAVRDGFVASDVQTHTYLFVADVAAQDNSPEGYPSAWKNGSSSLPADYEMDPEIVEAPAYAEVVDDALLAIPTISLVTDLEYLFDPGTGIYMNPEASGVAWERPVSVELLLPDGAAGFQIDAGLRIQGGASRLPTKSPKHSFRLLFKGIYGDTKLDYALFGDDAATDFDTIVLRAGFNQSWIHHNLGLGDQRGRAQYLRDQWAKETQLAMGGLAAHNSYAHLYINGIYWGLYNPTERPDAAFAAACLGGDKADYDALNSGELVAGDSDAWNQLFALANAGVGTEAKYQAVAERLDIDSFIDYMILNHYGGNLDWDHHNWYAFARRGTGGQFYFASWDAESIFISAGDDCTGLNRDKCPSRLLTKLAGNAEFRARFADRVHLHFHNGGALAPESVSERWSALADQVYDAVVAESARWGDYRRDIHTLGTPVALYERDVHWAAEHDRLLDDYFPGRTDTVLGQYRGRGLYPDLDAPDFSQYGGDMGAGLELAVTNPNASGTIYYTLDGTDPREAGGAVSLGARVYTGTPVALEVTTRVRARVVDGSEWSALTEAVFRSDAPDAVITELMADNDETLADEDGNFSDWIEVHNPTAIPVSLDGWRLTDDPSHDDAWLLPAVSLGPGDYLVVFASNKDRAVAGAELHTDFRLSDGGEYLALLEPDGSVACEFAPEYPEQLSDVSYGLATDRVELSVVAPGAAVSTLVPSDGALGLTWTGAAFDDSGWATGTTGVGYETQTGYEALIGADVGAMRNVNKSAYARIPFHVGNPSELASLTLRMKYDDGFAAWLNGHEVAARLAPDSPQWNSGATGQRSDSVCLVYEDIDLTDEIGFLAVGPNVLAIQGLNVNAGSTDLLVLPELAATKAVVDPSLERYFAVPTPGLPNAAGVANLGPVVGAVAHSPGAPGDGDDIVVTAEVRAAFDPIDAVTLHYRIMFGAETAIAMADDGTGPDAEAGDGIYTALIPASASSPGQMVRWRLTATDTAAGSSRAPLFPDPLDSPEYFGTVVTDPSLGTSLPVLHWFVANPSAANTRDGTRCSLFFDGELYDNVQVDLHGQSTAGFPKKSHDFDLNADDRFRYDEGERRVKDFNLLTNWADKAKVRNTMAYEVYQDAGAPHHVAFPVRVEQNGEFFSVADWVEDGDDRYLDRLGLDPDGALYKLYNDLSNASGAEKKTRKDEGNADLQALVDGLKLTGEARTQFLFDNVNIPEAANYLAATVITSNCDIGHKNYYLYRDTNGTGEWQILPWDVDLSFGHNWTTTEHYYDDTMYHDNSVFVGAHNALIGALYDTPAFREMFLRRVRTLMDQLLQPAETPAGEGKLEQRVAELVALIDPHDDDPQQGADDADLDYQKWGSWGNHNAMRAAAARITDEFLPARRDFLYNDQSVANGGEVPDAQRDLGAWPPGYQHVVFGTIEFNPASGNQGEEYVEIVNQNDFAVDLSGWGLRGAVELTFAPGTVVPAGGTLYASPDVNAFRARAAGPSGGQGLFVVGDYGGHLSAFGEALYLDDAAGRPIASLVYAGDPTLQQQCLRITEVMYHPAAPAEGLPSGFTDADDYEFVELQNVGTVAVNLAGARFADGIDFVFASHELGPGERVVIVRDRPAFVTRYGTAGITLVGEYGGSLSNEGERLRLEDSCGGVIHEIDYGDGWEPRTDGDGFSLAIVDADGARELWEEADGWRASGFVDGSPGATDPGLAPGSIVIHEALTHTDEEAGDWIELHNTTGEAIDIGGWWLSDDAEAPTKYQIAAGQMLNDGGFLVLTQRDHFGDVANDGCHDAFGLSELGESLYLTAAADGELLGYQESVSFGAAAPDVTFGRVATSSGGVDFAALSDATPADANAEPLVGPVVIQEIMYHPPDGGDEFIELRSIAAVSVALYDPLHTENTWRLDGAVEYSFPTGVTLDPGDCLLVVPTDPEAFRSTHGLGAGVPIFGPYDGSLDNDGESLKLYRPGEPEPDETVPWIRVDRVKYDDGEPWPRLADGWGCSLSRIAAAAYGNDVANWAASTLGGTPGAANELAVRDGGEVQLGTASLVGGRLNPQAPAGYSLGIEAVGGTGNPATALYAVKIGPDPGAGWLRFVEGARAQADAAEPQWHAADEWEGCRIVGLTPATAYDFYAKGINGPGPASDWVVVGSLATTSEGDVNGSGAVNALDYAYVRAAMLRGGELGDTIAWACDVNGDGEVDALDLAATSSGTLNPAAPQPAGTEADAARALAAFPRYTRQVPRRSPLDRDGDGDVDRDDIIARQNDYADLDG